MFNQLKNLSNGTKCFIYGLVSTVTFSVLKFYNKVTKPEIIKAYGKENLVYYLMLGMNSLVKLGTILSVGFLFISLLLSVGVFNVKKH